MLAFGAEDLCVEVLKSAAQGISHSSKFHTERAMQKLSIVALKMHEKAKYVCRLKW